MKNWSSPLLLLPAIALLLSGCESVPSAHGAAPHSGPIPLRAPTLPAAVQPAPEPTRVLDLKTLSGVEAIMPKLAQKRVVFVGEIHDRQEQHDNQLEIIRRLYALDPNLAIGMEYFQQPFQRYLDEFLAGTLDEAGMLKKTEYFTRWRVDYRLLRPMLQFARQNHIPLVALNLEREVHHKYVESGMDSLTAEEKARIPAEIDRTDTEYRERLKGVFRSHPDQGIDVDRMVEGQLLWDETMAESAAQYLKAHPQQRMVVLVGAGHVAYRSGIPKRLNRRLPMETAVVLTGTEFGIEPDLADYLLLSESSSLPASGKIGVVLDDSKQGVQIVQLSENSPAAMAGITLEDRIVAMDGHRIDDMADVKIALFDKKPGDQVLVTVNRSSWFSGDEQLQFKVTLK
jgi:uncharacterized iron-regulated protein